MTDSTGTNLGRRLQMLRNWRPSLKTQLRVIRWGFLVFMMVIPSVYDLSLAGQLALIRAGIFIVGSLVIELLAREG